MRRVAIYIRVSTTEQAEEGFSVPAQKEKLINYCKAREWIISDIYIDPGYSGSNINRPAIQKLITEIKNFDIVLVYKLDRLSRSQKDTLHLIEDVFLSNKVDFVSLSEAFDTSTPFGRASIGILSVFAQLERENIKERSKLGKKERAKNGLYHGGALGPIGYNYAHGELKIDDYEAMQIREIYNLYTHGMGIKNIVKQMENYHHKHGKWNRESVARIIDSKLYIGKINYYDEYFEGQHDAIVTEELFEKAKAIRHRKYNPKSFKYNSLLAGLIFCGNCGARYFMKSDCNGHYKYYKCYSRSKTSSFMIKDPTCKNDIYKEKELDEIIEARIHQIALDKNSVKNKKKKEEDNISEIKTLQKKLSQLEKKIDKLLDLYQLETIPLNDIGKKLSEVYAEKRNIENQIESLEEKKEEVSQIELEEVLTTIKEKWENLDLREKRKLLSFLINRIIIFNNKEIKIEWAF